MQSPQMQIEPPPIDSVRFDYVRPRRDAVDSGREQAHHRVHHRVPDVGELAVLEDEELLLFRQRAQLRHQLRREVGHDVHVRLEQADVRSDRVRQRAHFRRRRHVGAHAQASLLAHHQGQQRFRHRVGSR